MIIIYHPTSQNCFLLRVDFERPGKYYEFWDLILRMVPYWTLFLSYQGKRISNWFRIVSLDILIVKKPQFSKFEKINQSYPVAAIKVTPMVRSKLLILKI